MATPTTAIQIRMMQQECDKRLNVFRNRILIPFQDRLLDRIYRLLILRRPYTDDTFQMLQDLGIEPPD